LNSRLLKGADYYVPGLEARGEPLRRIGSGKDPGLFRHRLRPVASALHGGAQGSMAARRLKRLHGSRAGKPLRAGSGPCRGAPGMDGGQQARRHRQGAGNKKCDPRNISHLRCVPFFRLNAV
jgi:hypothetical protein